MKRFLGIFFCLIGVTYFSFTSAQTSTALPQDLRAKIAANDKIIEQKKMENAILQELLTKAEVQNQEKDRANFVGQYLSPQAQKKPLSIRPPMDPNIIPYPGQQPQPVVFTAQMNELSTVNQDLVRQIGNNPKFVQSIRAIKMPLKFDGVVVASCKDGKCSGHFMGLQMDSLGSKYIAYPTVTKDLYDHITITGVQLEPLKDDITGMPYKKFWNDILKNDPERVNAVTPFLKK